MLDQFHFLQPFWFLALVPLALLLWALLRRSQDDDDAWNELIDPGLLPLLLERQETSHSRWPLWLIGLGGLIAIVALANPVWQQKPTSVFETNAARVLVFDLSMSMYSPDIKPSRLVRARFKLRDLLHQPYEGQTGLVAFAGDAFVVTPLTRDVDTIESMLEALDPSIMPAQGSRMDLGLEKAVQLLRQAGMPTGHIIALADGSDSTATEKLAREARNDGYTVSVLAVGTPEGAPLPNGRGGVIRKRSGEVVLPKLDEAQLREISTAGGGQFARLTPDNSDINRLARVEVRAAEQSEVEDMLSDRWHETGPWLALLLLPFALLAFRKGWLLSLMLPLVILTPTESQAAGGVGDWFLNSEQRAHQALLDEKFESALSLSENAARRGAALYRLGDFEASAEVYSQLDTATGHYNRGNALVQQGKYDEAISAYDAALTQQPDMQDAIHNRALAEQLKQQPPQNQQQQQQNQDSGQGEQEQEPPPENQDQSSDQEQSEPQSDSQQDEGGEQQDEAEQQPQDQDTAEGEQENAEESESEQGPQSVQAEEDRPATEEDVAAEQWLRRVEDDPGELLRRKFLYQYQQRSKQAGSGSQQPW